MCGNVRSAQHGGDTGAEFSDNLTEVCALVRINIRHGEEIDGIQGVWITPYEVESEGVWHGGRGGRLDTFSLDKDEHITRVDGRTSANRVLQLTFFTNKGKQYGPYGKGGGAAFSESNLKVTGFFGRSGDRIDAIGVFIPGPEKRSA